MLLFHWGYNCLRSRYTANSDQQKTSGVVKVLEAKDKLLRTIISGELVFSHWICAKAAANRNSYFMHSIRDGSAAHPEEKANLFQHDAFL